MKIKIKSEKPVTGASDAAALFFSIERMVCKTDKHKERAYALGFDGLNNLIYAELLSMGTVNETHIYLREMFRTAIIKNAVAVIIGHNHPTGNVEPSRHDIMITKKAVEAGELLNVKVLDHIIYHAETIKYYSFQRDGNL